MEQLSVMVTGAGAVLGQGILRCLRMAHRPFRIITADPDYRAAGHWLGDYAVTIPMANDSTYLTAVERILAQEHVDILLIGTDVELSIFSNNKAFLENKYGAKIIVSPPRTVAIADDKLLTSEFLEREGFPFALSASADNPAAIEKIIHAVGFPLIAKPKQGARSVGVEIVNDQDGLARLRERHDMLIQEMLPDSDGEYTAGCLVVEQICMASVVLRRDLRDGNTYRAYADTSRRFEKEISAIAESLGVYGPCNFQFRVKNGRPIIFEINARFSGTTPIRAMFGFNEVIALIDHVSTGAPIPQAALKEGAVFRAWSDIFVVASQLESLKKAGTLVAPDCIEFPFRTL